MASRGVRPGYPGGRERRNDRRQRASSGSVPSAMASLSGLVTQEVVRPRRRRHPVPHTGEVRPDTCGLHRGRPGSVDGDRRPAAPGQHLAQVKLTRIGTCLHFACNSKCPRPVALGGVGKAPPPQRQRRGDPQSSLTRGVEVGPAAVGGSPIDRDWRSWRTSAHGPRRSDRHVARRMNPTHQASQPRLCANVGGPPAAHLNKQTTLRRDEPAAAVAEQEDLSLSPVPVVTPPRLCPSTLAQRMAVRTASFNCRHGLLAQTFEAAV